MLMDTLWIPVAFVLGFAVKQFGLPPLVGFLGAGFVLKVVYAGETEAEPTYLEEIGDVGVLLLLFTIGLKLKFKDLVAREVSGTAVIHMVATTVVCTLLLYFADFSMLAPLEFWESALIAFAMSFSSTVFAVKVLEGRGEMYSLHGRVSIGILVVQDVVAVIFLTASGKVPSPWALTLLLLPLVRPVLGAILSRAGHGEVLVLCGLFLTGIGAGLFDLVDLKPDLGALVFGLLLASHPKAGELSNAMLSLKDFFLLGFFVMIGLKGVPTAEQLGIAALLCLIVPLKVLLFFVLLTRFRLRARTATLTSLSLANYSEFGLIVAVVGHKMEWISDAWLLVFAIAVSFTYVIAAPLNTFAAAIYARMHERLSRFEGTTRHPEEQPVDFGDAIVAVFGMGRIGTGVYDAIRARRGEIVVGLDNDAEVVARHRAAGRRVVQADATDAAFWLNTCPDSLAVVMLAMKERHANLFAVAELRKAGYAGKVASIAAFDDDLKRLRKAGVDAAYNFYGEAGIGFALHVARALGLQEEMEEEQE
jgi:predicted Kef-type K+ transport protein